MTKTLNMRKLLLVLSLYPILSNCITIQNENVTSATENPKENPTYSVLENQSQSLRMESTTPITATLPSKLPLERPLRNENMDKSLKVLWVLVELIFWFEILWRLFEGKLKWRISSNLNFNGIIGLSGNFEKFGAKNNHESVKWWILNSRKSEIKGEIWTLREFLDC